MLKVEFESKQILNIAGVFLCYSCPFSAHRLHHINQRFTHLQETMWLFNWNCKTVKSIVSAWYIWHLSQIFKGAFDLFSLANWTIWKQYDLLKLLFNSDSQQSLWEWLQKAKSVTLTHIWNSLCSVLCSRTQSTVVVRIKGCLVLSLCVNLCSHSSGTWTCKSYTTVQLCGRFGL